MVWVVYTKDRSKLRKLAGKTWIYIGSDKGLEIADGILRSEDRKFIAEDIKKTADSVRDIFVDYVGKLSVCQKDKCLWYSSRLASKSFSQVPVFHQYVYVKLIENLAGKINKDILVVTDNLELCDNLRKISLRNVTVPKHRIDIWGRMSGKIDGAKRVLRYTGLWLICKFFKNKRLKEFSVFIHSWIDDRVFGGLPEFVDSYLMNLGDFLDKKKYCVARLTPIDVPAKYVFKLCRCFSNIVFPLSYLSFGNLMKCLLSKFEINFADKTNGVEADKAILDILAENEISRENESKVYIGNLLLYYACKSLGKRVKEGISFIYPFENQPWEKMVNMAFSEFNNRIGYQHSTIPRNFLDYRMSKYEKNAPTPGVILTSGKKWSLFLREYFGDTVAGEAGAFRFEHLFKERDQNRMNTNAMDIVVTLPIMPAVAMSLQRKLLKCLDANVFSGNTVKIKPHPYLSSDFSLKETFFQHKNCCFVHDDIEILLSRCRLFVTTSLSMTYEAVFLGIQTLYFVPEELEFGLDPEMEKCLFIAHEEDFCEKIREALSGTKRCALDIEEYFSKPDYEIFLEHLAA